MRWRGERQSDNVVDSRRSGPTRGGVVGGGLGLGGLLLVAIVYFLGGDPRGLLQQMQQNQQLQQQQAEVNPDAAPGEQQEEDEMTQFMRVVLASTEDVWTQQFRAQGIAYEKPKLVLFKGEVESACGFASAASGPFYCPGDSQLYIDTAFFNELRDRFKAPGDFAQAYVIAHEVGHHVQNLLGTSGKVQAARRRVSEEEYNQLSVRLELQADYYAGVWAHHANKTRRILEPGDLEEALKAAGAIGDDRIQMASRGYVVPESFTHGTSAQRLRWFKRGFDSGNFAGGDTFGAEEL